MKNIKECFSQSKSIVEFLHGTLDNIIDEGINDWVNKVKNKLGNLAGKVIAYAKGIVTRIQNWYMVTDEEGEILPCSTPLTMGAAWKEGLINKESTFVGMGKESGRLVDTSEPFTNALKMYPSTKEYWAMLAANHVNESQNEMEFVAGLCESNESNQPEFNEMLNEVKMANEDPQAKYNVIVDNKTLRSIIKRHINNSKLARLMVWGAPGIGKTAILTTVIDEISAEQGKDYSLIVKTLSNETPDNFMLPKYTADNLRAEDVPKTWMPVWKPTGDKKVDEELDAKCGRGLLFIDELSRATPQVQNVILPLINEGVINGWRLGSGWTIICASNRDEDDLSGQTKIGNALGNRFAQVYYEPCVKTWREWADKQGFISPLLTQWLSMPEGETLAGGKYFYWDPNEGDSGYDDTHIMCTPRSWTNAMRDLAEYVNTGTLEGFNIFEIDEWSLKFVLNQYVPAAAVDAFWAFLQTIHRIGNFDDAVRSAWTRGGAGLKIDKKNLIHIALPLAQLVICAHKDKLPTQEEFESFAKWLVKMDNEQLASYALDVFKNVFMANIPDINNALLNTNNKDATFYIKHVYAVNPQGVENSHIWDNFLKCWGVTFDNMPDYLDGLKMIISKYKDAFKSAVVDGVEALG